jgi:uncharacterized OB-fold protein
MSTVRELLEGWEQGLARGVIAIPRCENCGGWNWYPRSMCPACGSDRRALVELAPRGHIRNWTRVHRAFPPVQDLPVPYLVGLIELSDARGARVACRAEEPGREPVPGEPVELSVAYPANGEPFLTYRYAVGENRDS